MFKLRATSPYAEITTRFSRGPLSRGERQGVPFDSTRANKRIKTQLRHKGRSLALLSSHRDYIGAFGKKRVSSSKDFVDGWLRERIAHSELLYACC